MRSPEEIINIADARLEEAAILLKADKHQGAFYLAGYSVELYFKAKICERFRLPNLFDENYIAPYIGEIRRAVKTHSLQVLLTFSGLKSAYEELLENNPAMSSYTSFVMTEWNEANRYVSNNDINKIKIENLINNLVDFLQWIKQN